MKHHFIFKLLGTKHLFLHLTRRFCPTVCSDVATFSCGQQVIKTKQPNQSTNCQQRSLKHEPECRLFAKSSNTILKVMQIKMSKATKHFGGKITTDSNLGKIYLLHDLHPVYDGAFKFCTAKDSNPKLWFSGYHFIILHHTHIQPDKLTQKCGAF